MGVSGYVLKSYHGFSLIEFLVTPFFKNIFLFGADGWYNDFFNIKVSIKPFLIQFFTIEEKFFVLSSCYHYFIF